MALAAKDREGASRSVFLSRGAQVLERLAFYERGLNVLLEPVIMQLAEIVSTLEKLQGQPAPRLPDSGSLVERYDAVNRIVDEMLARQTASDDRHPEQEQQMEDIYEELSRITYELTRAIAQQASEQSRTWEEARPACKPWPVTEVILTQYLRKRYGDCPLARVYELEKLQGLNANEAFFLKVECIPDWPRDLILRRQIPVQIQPTPITREFDVLQSVYGHIPVPRPLLAETDKSILGQPFIILERLQGELKSLPDMGRQGRVGFLKLAEMMGRLHSLDPGILPDHRRAAGGDNHRWLNHRIDVYEQEWQRGALEPVHTVTAAFHWLRRHSGEFLSSQVIVHGDLDHRNVLFDDSLEIVAVIDWEVSHQGHPAEDLAYCRESVEKVMPWQDFVSAYLANGGQPVSGEEMRYAKVLSNLLRVTTSMIAHSGYVAGELDNFLMGTVRTIETEMACQYLHEAIYNCGA
jgi:aminoglycoside phosphotransferase (APT) family kinase protein